jgi:hypothetical protein
MLKLLALVSISNEMLDLASISNVKADTRTKEAAAADLAKLAASVSLQVTN